MGIKQMQGVPAHLEYIGPDGRKRRSNCGYYIKGLCYCKKSQSFMLKCVGRLCCGYYDDSYETRALYEIKRKNAKKATENDNTSLKYNSDKCNNKKSSKKKSEKQPSSNKELNQKQKREHPLLNKTIVLKSEKSGKKLIIRIVTESEDNPFQKLFSQNSKFAKAFVNKEVGDNVKVTLASNQVEYKILEIK